jgi:hypothetical protein
MNLPSLQAERARKWTEIDATPEAERQEIRGIYAAKGSSVEMLDSAATAGLAALDRGAGHCHRAQRRSA